MTHTKFNLYIFVIFVRIKWHSNVFFHTDFFRIVRKTPFRLQKDSF